MQPHIKFTEAVPEVRSFTSMSAAQPKLITSLPLFPNYLQVPSDRRFVLNKGLRASQGAARLAPAIGQGCC